MNYFRAGDNCLLCELFHPKNVQNKDILFDYSIVHAVVPSGEKSVPHRLNILNKFCCYDENTSSYFEILIKTH